MIREHWKKIGIDLTVQEPSGAWRTSGTAANENQIYAWNNDGSEHLFTFPDHVFPFDGTSSGGVLLRRLVPVERQQGKEPPPR